MAMTTKKIGLGLATAALAIAMAAGGYAAGQAGPDGGPFGRGGPGGRRGFGPAFGGPGRGGPGGPLGLLGPMARQLQLTDTQRDQLHGIMESHKAELTALFERVSAAHDALRDATEADTVDEGAIRAKSAAVAEAEADAAVTHARIRAETLSVLTAEQRTKLREARTTMRERMRERRKP